MYLSPAVQSTDLAWLPYPDATFNSPPDPWHKLLDSFEILQFRLDFPGVTENWERETNQFIASELDAILKTGMPSETWIKYNEDFETLVIRFKLNLRIDC